MTNDEIVRIRTALSAADEPTIREINRQGEVFLSAQLQAGLASDLRAMTMAAMLAAVLSFLAGGTASLLAAKIDLGWHLLTIAGLFLGFGCALLFAIFAAKPTSFGYAGSNPKHWVSDIEKSYTLIRSLAGQAALYADCIRENKDVLDRSHALLSRCLNCIAFTITGAIGTEFVLELSQVAKTGSFFAS